MKDATPRTIRLSEYKVPAWLIDHADLDFQLDPEHTVVKAALSIRKNPDGEDAPLVLDGGQDAENSGELLAISIDDKPLADADYRVDADALVIPKPPPGPFVLKTERKLSPVRNKSLEGLYCSSGNFCTQCEAEGFRKITWFLDRPDVMATYKVRLEADKEKFPVLLSNGNKIESGESTGEGGRPRHYAVWEDPHKKPAYLFALVAGNLVAREDTFTTMNGRKVDLFVWVEPQNIDQTAHCMESLKKSMKWDEETFGREYDLDIFNIVAVGDFNMGAMENKSLNIFNTKYVLAHPTTATDTDFHGIEAVVGHEYFHNWSGNRVTCRDWFQLSLKEGFTVFRDHSFSADMGSAAVVRIDEVRRLRSAQFPEDAGPTAHPIRPDSYVEISNFYTATVYEKGAEVVRLYQTLLGKENFRKGCDLYFERHDGQAATCEQFYQAMEDASGQKLGIFHRWYSQAGTPRVYWSYVHDADAKTFTLTLRQEVPPTPGQPAKEPMLIPVKTALLTQSGEELPLKLVGHEPDGASKELPREVLLRLEDDEHTFVFEGVNEPVVPSLLRGFSAPVLLLPDTSRWTKEDERNGTDDESVVHDQLHRMAHDTDPFNRWEASQELMLGCLLQNTQHYLAEKDLVVDDRLVKAFEATLKSESADPALIAQAITLPSESSVGDRMDTVEPEAIYAARTHLKKTLANACVSTFKARYEALKDEGPYALTPAAVGRRSLRNACLGYLSALDATDEGGVAIAHLESASNMTDTVAALSCLADKTGADRDRAFSEFYTKFEKEPLVVDKWLALQAMSHREDTLEVVRGLMAHPAFSIENPNKVRSLVGAFAMFNPLRFHAADGSGYAFLAEQAGRLDSFNPSIAARLLSPLARWRRQSPERQEMMKGHLRQLLEREGVSKDVFEICTKALKEDTA